MAILIWIIMVYVFLFLHFANHLAVVFTYFQCYFPKKMNHFTTMSASVCSSSWPLEFFIHSYIPCPSVAISADVNIIHLLSMSQLCIQMIDKAVQAYVTRAFQYPHHANLFVIHPDHSHSNHHLWDTLWMHIYFALAAICK